MSLPIVASLWIGGSLSYIEQVCLKSFVDHGHRTILYTYGEVGGVPEGVEVIDANLIFPNDNFIRHAKSGSPAVHADAFRYRMIELQRDMGRCGYFVHAPLGFRGSMGLWLGKTGSAGV